MHNLVRPAAQDLVDQRRPADVPGHGNGVKDIQHAPWAIPTQLRGVGAGCTSSASELRPLVFIVVFHLPPLRVSGAIAVLCRSGVGSAVGEIRAFVWLLGCAWRARDHHGFE